ncbi:methionine aminopeptidase [Violaceomyces palustris]|uniref:Methionine aminopeptidase n=1 Tax=Violaceomyces palustris TaxID=1673888 RepID=A0ACD0NU85_9BASI|nr:methionine aminopeptidase [Violaceomyces palustris]
MTPASVQETDPKVVAAVEKEEEERAEIKKKEIKKRTFDPFETYPGFKYAGEVRACYPLSPKPKIPPTIRRPNYAREGVRAWLTFWWQLLESRKIRVNPKEDQDGVRKAAILARQVLEIAASNVRPGITTDEIDKIVFEEAIKRDCYPSPLGYHGYPKSVCTSVNEVICHGIPDQRRLEDGDIVNLDVTLYHHGFHGDLNGTYLVGEKAERNPDAVNLIKTARDCLDEAISICGPGVPYAEIGRVIQPLAESRGTAVVRSLCGHGIGRVFHGAPNVWHHRTKKSYGIMQPGHIFTIEPMINLGNDFRDVSWPDDWTVSTVDGAWSAAAEETLLITEDGVEVLTAKGGPKKYDTTERRERLRQEIQEREQRKKRKSNVLESDLVEPSSSNSAP